MASFANIIKAKAAPIATPGLSHFDRILARQLFPGAYTKTVSGALVHVTDAIAGPALGAVLSIQFTQSGSGDPSPDNIRPITGWTGANVWRTGKNLFYRELSGRGIDSVGKIVSAPTYDLHAAFIKAGQEYQNSINGTAASAVRAYYTSEPYVGSASYNGARYTSGNKFTAPIDGYVAVRSDVNADKTQLEIGNTATAYEAYTGTTYAITWQDVAGTVYGGTLDLIAGTLTVTDTLTTIDENSGALVASVGGVWFADGVSIIDKGAGLIACDSFTLINAQAATADFKNAATVGQFAGCSNEQRKTRVFFRDERFTTTAALTAYLTDNPVHIVQKLATPQTYTITGTTPELLAGINNVWADTGDIALTYTGTKKE